MYLRQTYVLAGIYMYSHETRCTPQLQDDAKRWLTAVLRTIAYRLVSYRLSPCSCVHINHTHPGCDMTCTATCTQKHVLNFSVKMWNCFYWVRRRYTKPSCSLLSRAETRALQALCLRKLAIKILTRHDACMWKLTGKKKKKTKEKKTNQKVINIRKSDNLWSSVSSVVINAQTIAQTCSLRQFFISVGR